jgi:hypothetical protein
MGSLGNGRVCLLCSGLALIGIWSCSTSDSTTAAATGGSGATGAGGTGAIAIHCPSRCEAKAATCGTPTATAQSRCASLCQTATEDQMKCVESSDCTVLASVDPCGIGTGGSGGTGGSSECLPVGATGCSDSAGSRCCPPADCSPADPPTCRAASGDCYGAEACNPTGEPLGGGEGYSDIYHAGDARITSTPTNVAEFLAALAAVPAGGSAVLFIPSTASIDLTGVYGDTTKIPANVTIASDRGYAGSVGGRIFQNRTATDPHDDTWDTLMASTLCVNGSHVRITGLRIEGPDLADGDVLNLGIRSAILLNGPHKGLVVDNNEIFGWSYAGVSVQSFTETNQAEGLASAEIGSSIANIHHNYLHNIWGADYGYGVAVAGYEALIKANLFDDTRHSIAATGLPNEGYEASYNIQLNLSTASTFDVHGYPKDGEIAGTLYRIHHNTVRSNYNHAIGIRGAPQKEVSITFNSLKDCAVNCYAESSNAVVQFGYDGTNITMKNNLIDGVYWPSGPVGKVE